ncbi:MAG TPA: cupredoxin domain-containing protein [Allosphingosinicella sp.]|nr:cupredoxin domain-containing protein [Allosphingosinicella sp.]
MTRLHRFALAIFALPAAAAAQAPDWTRAQRVEVRLSSFDFTPSTLRLRAGRPVVLHLVNTGSGGHDFTAPAFFAAAQVRPRDRGRVGKGRIELRGRQSVEIALVPKAGTYPLKCSHAFHKTLGMSGRIVVD